MARLGVAVTGGRVSRSITSGGQDAPHRHVRRVAQVLCDDGRTFIARFLIQRFGPGAGGIAGNFDHVVVERLGVTGEFIQYFLVIGGRGRFTCVEEKSRFNKAKRPSSALTDERLTATSWFFASTVT